MNLSKSNSSIMVLLFSGVLMSTLDISIVGPAIPDILKYALLIETGTEVRAAVLGILMIIRKRYMQYILKHFNFSG